MSQCLERLGKITLALIAHLFRNFRDASLALPQQFHGAAEAVFLHVGPDGLAIYRLEYRF